MSPPISNQWSQGTIDKAARENLMLGGLYDVGQDMQKCSLNAWSWVGDLTERERERESKPIVRLRVSGVALSILASNSRW